MTDADVAAAAAIAAADEEKAPSRDTQTARASRLPRTGVFKGFARKRLKLLADERDQLRKQFDDAIFQFDRRVQLLLEAKRESELRIKFAEFQHVVYYQELVHLKSFDLRESKLQQRRDVKYFERKECVNKVRVFSSRITTIHRFSCSPRTHPIAQHADLTKDKPVMGYHTGASICDLTANCYTCPLYLPSHSLAQRRRPQPRNTRRKRQSSKSWRRRRRRTRPTLHGLSAITTATSGISQRFSRKRSSGSERTPPPKGVTSHLMNPPRRKTLIPTTATTILTIRLHQRGALNSCSREC